MAIDKNLIDHSAMDISMETSLEEILVSVWRQVLVEDAKLVAPEGHRYPVRRTSRRKLRDVDFDLRGQRVPGLEQNPETGSQWAELARAGKKVMQFLNNGRCMANVVDERVNSYYRMPNKSTDATF